MNKRKVCNTILLTTIIIGIILFYYFKPIDLSVDNLRALVKESNISYLIFLGLWIIRLFVFIPGMTLMLIGGVIFSPIEALILSLSGLVISDSIIFILGKSGLFEGLKNKIKEKYSDIYSLIEHENHKILAVGILCPIAPTDVICYLSSYLGLSYRRFIITFIAANIPALVLYSFLGDSFNDSAYKSIFIISTLVVTSVITIKEWRKLKLSINER